MNSEVVCSDLFQRNLGERLCNKLNDVIVVDDLVDVSLIVRAGEDDHLALTPHEFAELLKLVQEHKPVHNGHIDVQKDDPGDVVWIILILTQEFQRTFARILYFYAMGEAGNLYNSLTDEIISVIVIDQQYQFHAIIP